MTKFKLKNLLKDANQQTLVFLPFFIITLLFFQLELIPKTQIIKVNPITYFLGILIIIIPLIVMLVAINDLGRNFYPFPRPMKNRNLVTKGIYGFTLHPIYYSLILISFGVFIINLSIYFLCLTISLAFIIKFKIILEGQYLNNKFKNYFLYKKEVKY